MKRILAKNMVNTKKESEYNQVVILKASSKNKMDFEAIIFLLLKISGL